MAAGASFGSTVRAASATGRGLVQPARLELPLLDPQGPYGLIPSAGEARRDLCEVLQPRRAFDQVALEPAHRRLLVLRRSALQLRCTSCRASSSSRSGSSRAASSASTISRTLTQRHWRERIATAASGIDASGSTGRKASPSNLRRDVLRPTIAKANAELAKDGITAIDAVTFHSLRRTAASLRCACGDDLAYTSAWLGHTDPRFTLKVYARATRRRERLSGAHLREYNRAIEWAGMGDASTSRADGITDRSEVTANDLRTAYHEAGHAVIAFALRRRIKRISIEATATVSTTTLRPEQLKRRERDVVIAYGGLAAEGKYSGRDDRSATLDDQKFAVETTTDIALRRGEDPVVVLKPRLPSGFPRSSRSHRSTLDRS